MDLERLTGRVWVYPYEEYRDRPNLCYIQGDKWSLAVDAGHSVDHINDFYKALEASGLPLPQLTVLTHWHWDHAFAMHAAVGLCLANRRTTEYLSEFKQRLETEGPAFFFALDDRIRMEYKDGKPVIVTLPDMIFSGELLLDAGGCPIRLFQAESPHTDDSTLIEVPGERVLILGDSPYGIFPEWTVDPKQAGKLKDTIQNSAPEICVSGHQPPLSPETVIRDLMYGT